ncbi:MAG: type II toxin-antitoxin system ParD family antitoxin [Victivallales bacterium]|jgi:antitoxin ParD1/3/4
MNISLTSELDSWVHRKVKSGFYNSASEVVRESLRLLKDRDQQKEILLSELRSELRLGLKQIETGISEEFTEKTVVGIKSSGRKKLEK